MMRRNFLMGGLGAGLAALTAGCSPLGVLDRLGPRDRSARRWGRDIAYGDDPRQKLDLYGPVQIDGAASLPTVVMFYGGGWDSGSKALYGWAAQALAAQGFMVALPDYRLVPQVRFPVFIEDAALATAAVVDIIAPYGGDPERLGVLGHSAGAHLALMITLDRRYMAAVGKPSAIKAAVGLAGPYDFLPFDVPASVNAFGRAPDPTQTQPVAFVRADAAPVWLGHGTADDTVETVDTTILDDAIRAAGGRSEAKLYDGLDHADLIATFSPLFRKRAPVLADASAFLHRELG